MPVLDLEVRLLAETRLLVSQDITRNYTRRSRYSNKENIKWHNRLSFYKNTSFKG